MSDAPELKPCPFCGAAAVRAQNYLLKYLVACGNLDSCPMEPCTPDCSTQAEADAMWNRRA